MGASSSSVHENVSRVEFEELKKSLSVVVSQEGILMKSVAEMNKKLDILIEPEQSQGGEENINVDATIASAVKLWRIWFIGSSTHVPTSVETSEKIDLEMIVFQETPILRPQKRDRKKGAVLKSPFITRCGFTTFPTLIVSLPILLYEKFVEKNNDISVLSLSHNVAQYIQGGKILCATPWHLVDHVVMPINVKLQDHWICGRLNIVDRRIYLYNSLRSGRYMTAAKEACKPFSVILPYYFSMLDFKGLRNEAKFSTMEPFPIVVVDGLPEQVTASNLRTLKVNPRPLPAFPRSDLFFKSDCHYNCFQLSSFFNLKPKPILLSTCIRASPIFFDLLVVSQHLRCESSPLLRDYKLYFDLDGDGHITGNDALKFFALSNLSRQDLKQLVSLVQTGLEITHNLLNSNARSKLRHNSAAVQVPIRLVEDFKGLIDLVQLKTYYFHGTNGIGVKREYTPKEKEAEAAAIGYKVVGPVERTTAEKIVDKEKTDEQEPPNEEEVKTVDQEASKVETEKEKEKAVVVMTEVASVDDDGAKTVEAIEESVVSVTPAPVDEASSSAKQKRRNRRRRKKKRKNKIN
ncbi:hypothetical protein F8388_022359 [Cannabis sativa]|uniref:Ubiquitin-like protease family profile domain-containing protein n=1 Tax=Cannabis sativa TaxID=3483 RepID=A0A7J6G6P8_CANSA|nr:hypothetical protein F8388_022359 [Cannabis sativa]